MSEELKPEALEALRRYQQADEEGVMVKVSRQALDEVLAWIDRRSEPTRREAEQRVIEAVRTRHNLGPYHIHAGEKDPENCPGCIQDRIEKDALAMLDRAAPPSVEVPPAPVGICKKCGDKMDHLHSDKADPDEVPPAPCPCRTDENGDCKCPCHAPAQEPCCDPCPTGKCSPSAPCVCEPAAPSDAKAKERKP